jgi:arsenite-transporting ATPase
MTMVSIRVFEPALCCNTGVCGEDVDQALVDFSADLDFFTQLGVDIARHNLANDPAVFVQNPVVTNFLTAAGSEGLPLVLVDDVTVLTGRYPTRDMLARYAGLATAEPKTLTLATVAAQGCCGGSSSSCC